MAEIRLAKLAHSYGNGTNALKPLDMTWRDGGTYALLGPSGCGKSTMLNIISGLLKPSEGRVLFDGQDVTDKDTGARNIAQVFQVPVIYRSMTVGENLAFPLVCRRVSTTRIKARVEAIAERLGLSRHLNSRAVALTADQKQLISLGRGLVREDVSAVLLDEPLTVIDPQMKFELRKILKDINREFRLTMVLVTHDQNEALTFADTVVVMNHGEVIQAGTPQELFERPATTHVGTFIGSPAMNFLPAVREGDRVLVPGAGLSRTAPADLPTTDLTLGFRPEHAVAGGPLAGTVTRIWFEGADQVLALSVGDASLRIRAVAGAETVGAIVRFDVPQDCLRLYHQGRLVA